MSAARPGPSPASPFANLGRDTGLVRETRRRPTDQPPGQPARPPESQKSGTPETTAPALAKIGYRISTDAIDAVDDMYRILRRKLGIKHVTRQQIVEKVILAACDDLTTNGEASELAKRLSGTPDRKKAS